MNTYKVIGLMSGTSLDGVDLAYCIFRENNGAYTFEIPYCETVPYDNGWFETLKKLPYANANKYAETHTLYGRYLGKLIYDFIQKNKIEVDFVASHGHTVFHCPQLKFTAQIGEGAAIAQIAKLKVVCDFRTSDVAAGGQGAPLVPAGDKLLFADYDYCLNLGGFANISMQKKNERIAYDICPVNIVLNHIANIKGKKYDENGKIASSGNCNNNLLNKLNNLDFYKQLPPKSLAREWVEKEIFSLFSTYSLSPEDLLNTFSEHIACQVVKQIERNADKTILLTGGGAFNTYLVNKIKEKSSVSLIIPEDNIINYKEALIFAFLGILRVREEENCLKSVTGAYKNICGGAIYLY